MKAIIKLEELAMLVFSIYALYFLKVDWWYYLVLFVGPDISMLGYLAGNKTGAITYNLFHHKAVGIALLAAGVFTSNWGLDVTGVIIFGHSSMDRMLGYGLKYFEGFKFTHLGNVGKN
jgi:Domain of unknown function (DUF4260)